MPAPQAIETTYRGFRFRSRLEARWAVFYHRLGVPFDYEPQGFVIDGKPYLPDFWLPKQDCWVEIKGGDPTKEEYELASGLAKDTQKKVYIFVGPIPEVGDYQLLEGADESAHCYFPEGGADYDHWWCICKACGLAGIQFNGRSHRLPCACPPEPGVHEDKGYSAGHPRLVEAYDTARGARFEHDERFRRHA